MKSCMNYSNCNACNKRGMCSSYQKYKYNMFVYESIYESKVKDPASWVNPKWY